MEFEAGVGKRWLRRSTIRDRRKNTKNKRFETTVQQGLEPDNRRSCTANIPHDELNPSAACRAEVATFTRHLQVSTAVATLLLIASTVPFAGS